MIIRLTDKELSALLELAKQRHLPKRKLGIVQNFIPTSKGGVDNDLIGLKGEYGLARYLQVPFDDTIHYHGDDGSDLKVGEATVQVKSTFYRTGRVIYNMEDEFLTDYVVLAITDEKMPTVNLVGWADRKQWDEHHYIKYMGYGDRKVLDQSRLFPMETLSIPHEPFDPLTQLR